jgi:hypothetical protein
VFDKVWQSIHISKNGLGISHLLFDDDDILFIKASKTYMHSLIDVLTSFCNSSDLRVNFGKSRVMTSRNVNRHLKNALAQLSPVKFVSDLGIYLGFPLTQGRAK